MNAPTAQFVQEAENAPTPEQAGKQLLLTALHEAGHVVVACYLGVGIDRVTVQAEPRFYACDEPLKNMATVAVVAFAGLEAERAVDPGASDKSASIDYSLAREVFAQFFHDQDEAAFMARSRQQAKALVRKLWLPIQWVAARLCLDGEVQGETVRQILADGMDQQARERYDRQSKAFRRALANCAPRRGP